MIDPTEINDLVEGPELSSIVAVNCAARRPQRFSVTECGIDPIQVLRLDTELFQETDEIDMMVLLAE